MDAGEYVPDEITNLMVRNRIDESDAAPGFLLDGYPRTLAQVEELDGMIKFTGHELDAVVVLTVDAEELVQRLLAARRDRRSLRRHRGRDPSSPGGLHRADRAADRRLPRPQPADRGRRHGRGRRGHASASSRRSTTSARADPGEHGGWASATAGSRSRPRSRSARCGSPGCSWARPSSCCAASVRAGITTGELDAIAEKNIRDGGGVPSFLGYGIPPFPATICASVNDEVVHGIPGDRTLAGRRRHLDRLRCHRRRLARRRGRSPWRWARCGPTCSS